MIISRLHGLWRGESRNMVVTIWRVLQRKDENPIGKVSGGNCTGTLNEVSSWPTSRTIAQGVTKWNACSSGFIPAQCPPGCRGKLDVSTSIRAKILTLVFTSAPQGCNNDRPYISVNAKSDSCIRPPQRVISSESCGRSVLPLWWQLSQCNITLKYIELGSLPIEWGWNGLMQWKTWRPKDVLADER